MKMYMICFTLARKNRTLFLHARSEEAALSAFEKDYGRHPEKAIRFVRATTATELASIGDATAAYAV